MVAAFLRLAMLAALVLMPFGMGAMPAQAAAVGGMPEAMASGHCDDSQGPLGEAPVKSDMQCMACAALPAAQIGSVDELRPVPALLIRSAHLLFGIDPEIATPPPKRS